ncbi:MAG: hypothetical protein WC151_09970 [Bacteroidales bacterium]
MQAIDQSFAGIDFASETNFIITGTGVTVESQAEVSVSPNPAHDDVVVIGLALSSVQIYTLDGTLVLNSVCS